MATWIIAKATIITAGGTLVFHHKQNETSKKHIEYMAMLEIMKIFNDRQNAKERHVIYIANQNNSLYEENGDIKRSYPDVVMPHPLPMYVASTLGTFDQIGKLVKEVYVDKEEFLDMYVDPVIRMGKTLQRNILFERKRRNSDHFMVYFDWIFNEARIYWDNNFSGQPEPEPF